MSAGRPTGFCANLWSFYKGTNGSRVAAEKPHRRALRTPLPSACGQPVKELAQSRGPPRQWRCGSSVRGAVRVSRQRSLVNLADALLGEAELGADLFHRLV